MRVLVALFAAFACVVAKPAAVTSVISPWNGLNWGGLPLAVSSHSALASPAVLPVAQPWAAPIATPWAAPLAQPWAAPIATPWAAPLAQPWAAPLAQPWAAPITTPWAAAGLKTQWHAQDELGQASYGHAEPGQTHNAIQDAAGNKVGSFSFINPEGKLVQTSYVADAAGYRVASNDLPVAPVDAGLVAPAPIADTPEVVSARLAHLAEVEAAKSRSKRSAVLTPAGTTPILAAPIAHAPIAAPLSLASPWALPWASPLAYAAPLGHAWPTTNTIPIVTGPNGYLADTPEVAAAKALHLSEVAAARARVGAW